MTGPTPGEAIAHAINASSWVYPAANVAHVVGIVLVVGPVLAFDFRLLGLTSAGNIRDLARVLLPWPLVGLLIAVPAGLVLFASESTALLTNPAFRLKLLLLTLAASNAIALHASGVLRGLQDGVPAPLRPKLHAALSVLLWISVVACGRMIAYV
ncbi:MAG: hypothetical protein ABI794_11210 [Betaproteobacteria bacterium]